MNKHNVQRFLQALGCESVREGEKWINAKCPLAPYTHGQGKDRRPSFGISVSEGRSLYHCFSCTTESRSLMHLIHRLHCATGEYPKELSDLLIRLENWQEIEKSEVKDVWEEAPEPLPLFPQELLDLFPLLMESDTKEAEQAKKYLCYERGIDPDVMRLFGLRYDTDPVSVIFPFTNSAGELCVLRRRAIANKFIETISVEGFPTLKSTGAWFGLHLCSNKKPLILVEAEIDALRLASVGYDAIASGGTSVTQSQVRSLLAPSILVAFDADDAGRKGTQRIVKALGGVAIVSVVDWNSIGLKDPTDRPGGKELATKEELKVAIEEAGLCQV